MAMTLSRIGELTVRDIDRLILECRRCGHALHLPLRQDGDRDFPVDTHQACPVCNETWWGPRSLDEARGQPARPPTPPMPVLVRAVRNAFRAEVAEMSAVNVKLAVSMDGLDSDGGS